MNINANNNDDIENTTRKNYILNQSHKLQYEDKNKQNNKSIRETCMQWIS